MPNTAWLKEQPDALRVWIARNNNALLVSTADGGFLYVNQACELLLGYSSHEFKSLSWQDLTVESGDLEADNAMVSALQRGERESYEIQKSYRHKTGFPVECFIHVIRYPLSGKNVDFFLVAVRPVAEHRDFLAQKMEESKLLVLEQFGILRELMTPKPSGWERLESFYKSHPVWASGIGLLISFLLFGERVKEVFDMVMGAKIP